MFAVRDTRTGKFLRRFSGSYNRKWYYAYHSMEKAHPELADPAHPYYGNPAFERLARESLWSADTVADAKIYANIGGVKNSVGPMDYHEIVPVQIV